MAVEFRLLGAIEVRVDDRPVDIGPARQQCVLAALLVDANNAVSIDQLVDRVWGRHPPLRVRGALHSYLARLRRALADVRDFGIVRRSGGYALTVDEGTVDLCRFRRLLDEGRATDDDSRALELFSNALRLWRGEPFTGLDTPWLAGVRASVDKERQAAELDHADIGLRQGRHAELLAALHERAAERPLDERLAAQLMLALYRSGRQADALDHYHRTRLRLADELGTDPSPPLRELHHRILTGHPRLDGHPGTVVSVRPPTPRQLPAAPRLFTGRADELAALTATLDTTANLAAPMVVSAIGGAGGIGKTWLALHWAHQHLARFPDGQLYVNLRGFDVSEPPLHPAAAVRGFLDALGVDPAAIPLDLDARTALYRSLVVGRRMLVLLDNARDSAQVEPLLPGGKSCTVLVTGRHRFAGLITAHGAARLDVGVLDDSEAHELLARHLGPDRVAAEPDAVAELRARCAGLPLALRIVAARAAANPGFPLAVLADELRESSARLDALDAGELTADLRTVLSCSYRASTAEAASLFELLGLMPGPDISLPAVAALAALPTARAGALLRELEALYLVSQHTPGRYRMHDLVRLHAAEQQRSSRADCEAVRTAALRRLVDFYLHTAYAGERLLYPHRQPLRLGRPAEGCSPTPPSDAASAMAWFDAEHLSLLAAQNVAAQQGLPEAVWQLAWSLNNFHRQRGHVHDDVSVWRAGLDAAMAAGDPVARARAHRCLAHAYARTGQHDQAIAHARDALIPVGRADSAGQPRTRHALWPAQADHGDIRQALGYVTQALHHYRTHPDPLWEADMLDAMGYFSALLGDLSQARDHCEAALHLFRRHHDRVGEGAALDTLGYIAHHSGLHAHAQDYYHQALDLRRDIGNTYAEADTLSRLGDVLAATGQRAEARNTWDRALGLYRAQHRTTHADRIRQRLATLDQT
ncbi:DNA-binding SARP family transcriptional activator/Tfp pilus assembly protein PilF [Saccharothrix tamanrassetensis]|uniref:DNA-binding SARP family transcriptional activator/Tfp pilus assembly protein PilF n=1 Tax=Saccharothrix tamanrassetensis TaxID=1051531 RepID=A0A841CBI9_9PSEU|nr:BTAD domain-containing putative transcriptional regulator [Saccharothrix tamanrassetensis]MBB5954313.1 DNA-binding SARP family transcriptional activator/Tfp pilus assembly protein PilF [Saccharothrix tamanrassetensis]